MLQSVQDNYQWATAVLIPVAAPIITIAVDKFGSPKVKAGWHVVRCIYRKALKMKEVKR